MSGHEDETLTEALIRHQRIPLFDGTRGQRCVGCDDLHGETDGPNSPRHADHLAQVILASDWLAARDARVAATARADAVQEAADNMPLNDIDQPWYATAVWLRRRASLLRAATEDRCTCGVGDHRPPGAHGIHCADPDASAATEDPS